MMILAPPCFVGSNGVIIPFVDGVNGTADLIGSVSDSNNMTTNNNVRIGWNERDNAYIAGSISQLRVVKGKQYIQATLHQQKILWVLLQAIFTDM